MPCVSEFMMPSVEQMTLCVQWCDHCSKLCDAYEFDFDGHFFVNVVFLIS